MAMSVIVRPYRRGGWEVDITVRLPNGSRWRERSKAPVSSKSAAVRWGEDRERHVLQHGLPQPKKEVPTLEEFAPRFLDGHARHVPLTVRLAAALREHRHLRSDRVLCQPDGSPMSADVVKHHVERSARRAHIAQSGVHRLSPLFRVPDYAERRGHQAR
jgi:hypothetical protein